MNIAYSHDGRMLGHGKEISQRNINDSGNWTEDLRVQRQLSPKLEEKILDRGLSFNNCKPLVSWKKDLGACQCSPTYESRWVYLRAQKLHQWCQKHINVGRKVRKSVGRSCTIESLMVEYWKLKETILQYSIDHDWIYIENWLDLRAWHQRC